MESSHSHYNDMREIYIAQFTSAKIRIIHAKSRYNLLVHLSSEKLEEKQDKTQPAVFNKSQN